MDKSKAEDDILFFSLKIDVRVGKRNMRSFEKN